MALTKTGKQKGTQHVCDTCGDIYYNKGHFVQHQKSHVAQKIFPCSECNKKYTTKHLLKRHLATHNGGTMYDRKYTCEHCGATFISSSHLMVHLRTHTGEKPFACQKCDKAFIDKSTLMRHVKTVHEKQKPYVCDKCGKSFTQSCHLKGHILTHSEEKPHLCTRCPKMYSDPQMLKRHVKIHEIKPDKKVKGRKTNLEIIPSDNSVSVANYCQNILNVTLISTSGDSESVSSASKQTYHKILNGIGSAPTVVSSIQNVNSDKMKPKLIDSEPLPFITPHDKLNHEHCSSQGLLFPKKNVEEFKTKSFEESIALCSVNEYETIDNLVTQLQNDSLTNIMYKSLSEDTVSCDNIQLNSTNNETQDNSETDEISDNSLLSVPEKEILEQGSKVTFLAITQNSKHPEKGDFSNRNYSEQQTINLNNKTIENITSCDFETDECNFGDKSIEEKSNKSIMNDIDTKSNNFSVICDNIYSDRNYNDSPETCEIEGNALLSEERDCLKLNGETTESTENEPQDLNQEVSSIFPSEHVENHELLSSKKMIIRETSKSMTQEIVPETRKEKIFSENQQTTTYCANNKEKSKVMCYICGKTLSSIGNLSVHIRTHTGEKPYTCNICDKPFMDKSTLNRHLNIHTGQKKYVCQECGKSFSQSSHLKSHQSVHIKEKDFKCSFCEKGFANKRYLTLHLRQHTSSKSSKVLCNQCGKSFTSSRSLKSHVVNLHGGPNRYNCEHCSKPFLFKYQLQKHLMCHSEEKPFECVQCNKKYKAERYLKLHMMSHTGERPFICDICGKGFTQERSLKSHQLRHFDRNSDISNELKEQFKKHDEIALKRQCVCNVCGKLCRDKAVLVLHMRKHTGEKPYKCNECTKGFVSGYRLKVHKLSHASKKPYVCNYCKKGFVQKWNLKAHMLVHQTETPFQCKTCKKFLNSQDALAGHERTHTGEKPFECPVCFKTFSQRTNWSAHKSKHLNHIVQSDPSVSI